jgi:tetratricopeptide (TPR) repeat protein
MDYNEAIRLNPKRSNFYYFRGTAFFAKSNYVQAITDFREAIQLNPKDEMACELCGDACFAMRDYDQALANYSLALELNPKNARASNNRGYIYAIKRDFDKALADYDQAIQLDPKYAKAFYNRGGVHELKHDYDKVLADYGEAVALDPKNENFNNTLAWFLATCPQAGLRNGSNAVEYATQACQLAEWKLPADWDTLAAAYVESGDFGNAVKWETKFLETPGLDKASTSRAQSRLTLYQAHQPYHASP